MYGILQHNHDNPIELYMCLGLWSNIRSQNTIWDQKKHSAGTGYRTARLGPKQKVGAFSVQICSSLQELILTESSG